MGNASDEVVNWDGVLTQDERSRILERLRSALGAVGEHIPETVILEGRQVRLKDTIFNYLEKEQLSTQEKEDIERLIAILMSKVRELESRIRDGEIDEVGAVDLMKEVLGLLRAVEQLRNLRSSNRLGPARANLMGRVNDEKRWLQFLKSVK